MKKYLLFTIIIIATVSCSKHVTDLSESVSYSNPILPAGPDPWVIQKDKFYYYTNTSGDKLELWKTKSLSRLGTAARKTIWVPPATGANTQNIWAPELHFFDGKWYMYYAAGPSTDLEKQRLFVLENSAADPMEGTWLDKGEITTGGNNYFSIDATAFDLYNKRYFIWSSKSAVGDGKQRLYIAELLNPWTLGNRVLLSSPEFGWEQEGSSGGDGVIEAPEILVNPDGKVFLVYSASACWTDGYSLGYMFLKSGADPLVADSWIKNPSPVLTSQPGNNAYGPGHCAFFKSPDSKEDWILYHANNDPGQVCSPFRNPRIQKFTWNSDGTPNFGEPVPAFKRLLRPSGEKD